MFPFAAFLCRLIGARSVASVTKAFSPAVAGKEVEVAIGSAVTDLADEALPKQQSDRQMGGWFAKVPSGMIAWA